MTASDVANIMGQVNQYSACHTWVCQVGFCATVRLASGVWATLARLNILKRAMLDCRSGCVLGSMV